MRFDKKKKNHRSRIKIVRNYIYFFKRICTFCDKFCIRFFLARETNVNLFVSKYYIPFSHENCLHRTFTNYTSRMFYCTFKYYKRYHTSEPVKRMKPDSPGKKIQLAKTIGDPLRHRLPRVLRCIDGKKQNFNFVEIPNGYTSVFRPSYGLNARSLPIRV